MADLQELFRAVDELNPDEFRQLYDYLSQRRRTMRWWVVPRENIAKMAELSASLEADVADLTEEEINSVIDEAIAEVRQERKNNPSRH
jgi:hypothetical protein